jgi:nucleoside-diphosphate-sugar epimerase
VQLLDKIIRELAQFNVGLRGLGMSDIHKPISRGRKPGLNYAVEVTFKEGLRRTVEWYKNQ